MMSKVAYPRPCPNCSKLLKNRFTYCTHKRYCGKNIRVLCLNCEKTFARKDMVKHVKKFHSETAKRKAAETDELARLKLLHADKVPRLSNEHQTGGGVTTRGMKRETTEEDSKHNVKAVKPEDIDSTQDTRDDYDSESNPLFVADVKKLGPAKRWKNNAVVNQKFIMTLDQQRGPKEDEDLDVEATHAIAVATDNLIEELKIPEDYRMTMQKGSKEHRRDGLTG